MNGWVATPDDRPVGGVVLIHEVFGVNHDMRGIAERFAAAGYHTVVPALFDKIQREAEFDTYLPNELVRGEELASQLGKSSAVELVATAAEAIAHAGNIALVGYGWGGIVAKLAARALRLPCVVYYGTQDDEQNEWRAETPVLNHVGEMDTLYASRPPVDSSDGIETTFLYPSGHAFDRQGDALHYHPESASLALQRTLTFLDKHTRSSPD
jgi:carboxymethylenebutenolidase